MKVLNLQCSTGHGFEGWFASEDDFQGQLSGLGYDWLTGGLVTGDPDGHGTHVSGIIAAALNGQGVHGVAYDATLAPNLLPQPPTADAAGLRPSANELLARAEQWRPWRAYAAQHLWAAA